MPQCKVGISLSTDFFRASYFLCQWTQDKTESLWVDKADIKITQLLAALISIITVGELFRYSYGWTHGHFIDIFELK